MEPALRRLEANRSLLLILNKAKPRLRKAIISNSDDDLIQTISEIAYNTIKGNCSVDKQTCEKLRKFKKPLRFLSCPKQPLRNKRKLLIQKGYGAFLPLLLGTVLSALLAK